CLCSRLCTCGSGSCTLAVCYSDLANLDEHRLWVPNTLGILHPQTIVIQIDVSDEVVAAPLTRLQTVSVTVESSDWHIIDISGALERRNSKTENDILAP